MQLNCPYHLPVKYSRSSRPINNKEQLFNDVLELLEQKGVKGWPVDTVQTIGARFVDSIVDVLWCLGPHYDKLKDRAVHLPRDLQAFSLRSYNWREKKNSRPPLEKTKLESMKFVLGDLLLQPWISRQDFKIYLE